MAIDNVYQDYRKVEVRLDQDAALYDQNEAEIVFVDRLLFSANTSLPSSVSVDL